MGAHATHRGAPKDAHRIADTRSRARTHVPGAERHPPIAVVELAERRADDLTRAAQVGDEVRAGLGDDADDAELVEQLIRRRAGLGLFEYGALLVGVIDRRLPLLRPARTRAAAAATPDTPPSALVSAREPAEVRTAVHVAREVLVEVVALVRAAHDAESLDARQRRELRRFARAARAAKRALSGACAE